ncbi:DNA primase [Neorhizobium sp. P12A]|uniref:DUF7146 domain-containing protein n=1 Tax=Neorhizobium sp. P12A TaxID=2268027 RepID=UPI0011ED997C|nr:toprim domain-containing protein [Neorhizobium sp. P12A]KAA0693727.1 DNA primase [Neorhizobium sp. P12A]
MSDPIDDPGFGLSAEELADRLALVAEAVCRHYLSAGRRAGNYWIVGDVANNSGRSLYIRLTGPRAGRWTDAATGQYGDLLDLIRESGGLNAFRDVAAEARHFLRLPAATRPLDDTGRPVWRDGGASPERARRLLSMTRPIAGTLAERYLCGRGIDGAADHAALRFHPACHCRDLKTGRSLRFPALVAAVTNSIGEVTAIHRTFLDPRGQGKARIEDPRRALGHLLGNAVRFRFPPDGDVVAAVVGEGLETVLSLSQVVSGMPMAAALSAAHLAAFVPPAGCLRLYIAGDADAAGRRAVSTLRRRAEALGIRTQVLNPELGDFNEDLLHLGSDRLLAHLRDQIAPEDAAALRPAQ